MQLLYIWIKNYKCLNDVEMNFCEYPRYKFDEERKTLCQISMIKPERTIFPSDEFSCIENISVIAGSNGSGKTTVCSLIRELICNENFSSSEYIIVWKANNKILYKSNLTDLQIHVELTLAFEQFKQPMCDSNLRVVYYSPHYSISFPFMEPIGMQRRFIDCSTSFVLKNDVRKYSLSVDQLTANKIQDFYRCISFYSSKEFIDEIKDKNGDKIFKLGTNLPETLLFSFDDKVINLFKKEVLSKKEFHNLNEVCNIIMGFTRFSENKSKKEVFMEHCVITIFCSYFLDFFRIQKKTQIMNVIDILIGAAGNKLQNYNCAADYVYAFFEQFLPILKTEDEHNIFWEKCNTIKWFLRCIEDIYESHFRNKTLKLSFKDDFKTIKELYSIYQRIVEVTDFGIFDLSPELSAGETSEALLYGRLLEGLAEVKHNKTHEHVLLFLDEVEITLHPQLQRQLILNLCAFLQAFYKELKFQIIFATHSPILLSDIPKSNVILLQKKEGDSFSVIKESENNTFACNIGEMFYDHFFMTETIGAFAKNEILKALELIKEGKRDEAKCIIEYVGDDLFKEILTNKLD